MQIQIRNLQKKLPIIPKGIKKIALRAVGSARLNKAGQICLVFADDKKMRRLNARFLGKNKPTDVLVFDLSRNQKYLLADVVISVDTAIRNAKTYKTKPCDELRLYVIHGILHLGGYRDATKKEYLRMQKKTQQILASLR
jgi:probable rRNA maturation factor